MHVPMVIMRMLGLEVCGFGRCADEAGGGEGDS